MGVLMCPLFYQLFEVFFGLFFFALLLFGFLLSVQQRGADAQLLQLVHQVSVLVHLEQDVAASHKLAIEVDLRDRGPVGELFDSCGGGKTAIGVRNLHLNQGV